MEDRHPNLGRRDGDGGGGDDDAALPTGDVGSNPLMASVCLWNEPLSKQKQWGEPCFLTLRFASAKVECPNNPAFNPELQDADSDS